jgi:hypothetical protein
MLSFRYGKSDDGKYREEVFNASSEPHHHTSGFSARPDDRHCFSMLVAFIVVRM